MDNTAEMLRDTATRLFAEHTDATALRAAEQGAWPEKAWAAVEEAGGTPRVMGIVRDTPEVTRRMFLDAFDCDVVLSTGGVSMGAFDLVGTTLSGYLSDRFDNRMLLASSVSNMANAAAMPSMMEGY